jgi:hypothetical protein
MSTEARRALSTDEWLSLDEDAQGELVDGWLVEEEVPDFTHELTISWLIRVLGAWLGGARLRRRVRAENPDVQKPRSKARSHRHSARKQGAAADGAATRAARHPG